MQLIDSLIKPIVDGDHTGQNLWEPGDLATARVCAKKSGINAAFWR